MFIAFPFGVEIGTLAFLLLVVEHVTDKGGLACPDGPGNVGDRADGFADGKCFHIISLNV